jgi:endonuclease/exonuclease/phosphatase (EEP) superfamily protein YafD
MNEDMTTARARRTPRDLLRKAIWIAWGLGVLATLLGFAAAWIPVFDVINDGRAFSAAALVVLLIAAIAVRDGPLIRPTAALALLHIGLLLLAWNRGAEHTAGAAPSLRLVTFNIGVRNDRFDEIADFLVSSRADIVLLQGVSCAAADRLMPKLRPTYPHALVSAETCQGQALLAKRPWLTGGQVITGTRRPLLVWAHFQWDNTHFDLAGLHFANPFAGSEQADEVTRLLAHLGDRLGPQIVAGDFNLTPFSWRFAQLQNAGLGQHATFLATWPANWPGFWPQPLFLLDNVLSTREIASAGITTGRSLGSDHRPLIADIVLKR